MHTFLNTVALVGVASALSITPTLVVAQDGTATAAPEAAVSATVPAAVMTPEQDAAIQAWPDEQQAAFKLWPAETQVYYWTLTADRQKMFWALSDNDKVALSAIEEPQRESIWAQIETHFQLPRA